MPKVLVVDDEESIRQLVSFNLAHAGFEVAECGDGLVALTMIREEEPDLVILDLMLPGMNGLEVCRRVRREFAVPILMLTARDEETDRVRGLETGADDYLTKPFSPRELVARVKAILRRAGGRERVRDQIVFGSLSIDRVSYQVSVGGRPVELTNKEYQMLELMATNPGRVFSREKLLELLWGNDYFGDNRTIDVHMRHLREKLEEDSARPRLLLTVRGVGYKFEG